MELSERKLRILQAIIGDFISTAEPVGSRALSKKYNLGISPATIRNEMADLEEMGFLTHPHTSAGRVPSEKAYRLYVDDIMKKSEIPEEQKEIIAEGLVKNFQALEKTIQQAAKILSNITNLTAFAITPDTQEDVLKTVNLLPVDDERVVIMIVSESGKVSNTTLSVDVGYSDEMLDLLSKSLTYNYRGKTVDQALKMDIISAFESDVEVMSKLAENIMPNFLKTLKDMLNVNIYMDGLTNIFSIPEYSDISKAKSFMEVVQKKDKLLKTIADRDTGTIITIGTENNYDELKDYSLITATYHVDGKYVGKLGVIGPTRMKYDEITSVIEYLTNNISNLYKLTEGNNRDEKDEE